MQTLVQFGLLLQHGAPCSVRFYGSGEHRGSDFCNVAISIIFTVDKVNIEEVNIRFPGLLDLLLDKLDQCALATTSLGMIYAQEDEV